MNTHTHTHTHTYHNDGICDLLPRVLLTQLSEADTRNLETWSQISSPLAFLTVSPECVCVCGTTHTQGLSYLLFTDGSFFFLRSRVSFKMFLHPDFTLSCQFM